MWFLNFWKRKLQHPIPVGRIIWRYQFSILVVAVVAATIPGTFNDWLLGVLLAPSLLLAPVIEIGLLIRERNLLGFLKRFWWVWLIALCWPWLFYALALYQGWVLNKPIGWIFYLSLVIPLLAHWSVRMHRRGLL